MNEEDSDFEAKLIGFRASSRRAGVLTLLGVVLITAAFSTIVYQNSRIFKMEHEGVNQRNQFRADIDQAIAGIQDIEAKLRNRKASITYR